MHPMPKRSSAALQLKRLRVRTGLTVQQVASALGKPKSTYAAYEDKFKKPFLPMDLVKDLVPVLCSGGAIDRGELLALAGISDAYDADSQPATHAQAETSMASIEELDVTPAAGGGATVQGAEVVRTWVLPQNVISIATESSINQIKIVRVKGDSMSPTYNPLDRLMVDTDDTVPSPGGVFIVWDGLGLVVKRVQLLPHSDPPTVRITSDNDKYAPYERILGEAYIQGRVIGKWLWT